jgi:hypothetical protein
VPPNRNGLGYVCYARDGLGYGFDIGSREVTQELEGAPDLDVGPAEAEAPTPAGRVWCEKGKTLTIKLSKLAVAARLTISVRDPDDALVAAHSFAHAGDAPFHLQTAKRGWHRVLVQVSQAPANGAGVPYALSVSYTAPSRVSSAELAEKP